MASSSAPVIVAVTGASGYIASHVCLNLVQHGFHVKACVRDKSRKEKTQHLLDMNQNTDGSLQLFEADMMVENSYDAIFQGCQAVFHVAGNFGTDRRWTEATEGVRGRPPPMDTALMGESTSATRATATSYDQGVYDSYVVPMQYILDSIARSGTVKRLVYTSSGCTGSIIYDQDRDDDYTVTDNAYGKGKVDCEKLIYRFGERHDVICCSSCPTHVLGPILAAPLHDMTYQHRLGEMFAGKYCLDQNWNVCDVRDVAETQRLIMENSSTNGSRYFNGAPNELTPNEMVSLLRKLFPEWANQVAEAPTNDGSDDASRSEDSSSSSMSDSGQPLHWASSRATRWGNPETELGLRRHAVADTIRDTIDSMLAFDMIDRPDVPTEELWNFYQVAEMDGCEEEMEYILSQIKKRKEAGEY